MAALEYPRNTVWYIEARPAATQGGYAPADAASMGSAVLIELQQEVDQGGEKKEVEVTRYLLTCAHVVRAPSREPGMLGPLYEEILCFEPGKGYMRTRTDNRKSLTADGVPLAQVSEYSPCKGVSGSVLMTPQTDWVLLKVEGYALKNVPTTRRWADVSEKKAGRFWLMLPSPIRRLIRLLWGQSITILGYPGGAGFAAFQQFGAAWETTDLVENRPSEGFRQIRTPEHGLLLLDGPDETRPGMSGGGVFDQNEDLVGIHRAATDATMGRDAISIRGIQDHLWKHHRLSPVSYPPSPLKRPWLLFAMVGLLLVGGCAFLFWPEQHHPLREDPIPADTRRMEDPPPVIPADVTAQFTVYTNHQIAENILVRLKVKDEQNPWQEERRSDEGGKVSLTIPGSLSKAKFKVSLPDYGAAFRAMDYTLREKSFPLNVPPKPGEYQPFKLPEPAEQKP